MEELRKSRVDPGKTHAEERPENTITFYVRLNTRLKERPVDQKKLPQPKTSLPTLAKTIVFSNAHFSK